MAIDNKIGHADLLISRMHLGMDPVAVYGTAMLAGEKLLKLICFSPDDGSIDALAADIPRGTVRGICSLRGLGQNVTYFCVIREFRTLAPSEPPVLELTMELEPISIPVQVRREETLRISGGDFESIAKRSPSGSD